MNNGVLTWEMTLLTFTVQDYNLDTTVPDDHPIMLITCKSGSEGITLVHAIDCFIMSPSWNPHIEDQMIARVCRTGQLGRVIVWKFYSTQSVEVRIYDVQFKKRHAARTVLNDDLVAQHARIIEGADDAELLDIVSCSTI